MVRAFSGFPGGMWQIVTFGLSSGHSPLPGASSTYDVHYTILGAGLLGIENLRNLAAIKDKKATIICGIPLLQEGSGGPARILAMVE